MAKSAGEEMLVPINDGPMAGCNVARTVTASIPTSSRTLGRGQHVHDHSKEIHTLNDAILAAAKELSTRPKGRRRIIYVISDGKEYGSKATYKEVLRYLETNKIAVYARWWATRPAGARAT